MMVFLFFENVDVYLIPDDFSVNFGIILLSRPNRIAISQMWQLPLHFQVAPNNFTIIQLENDCKSKLPVWFSISYGMTFDIIFQIKSQDSFIAKPMTGHNNHTK